MRYVLKAAARVALVVALVSGWSAGLLHPLQHMDGSGRLVHLADLHSTGDQKPASTPSDKLCDALAGLAACLGNAPTWLADVHFGQAAFPRFYGAPRAAAPPPFLAQGPPVLL